MKTSARISLPGLSDQSGVTLVELAVATVVLGIIMSVFLGILVTVQTSMARETVRSTTMDQARLAVEGLDRDIRSGNVLYDPAGETKNGLPNPNYGLRIATKALPGYLNEQWCVQYRVENQTLLRRSWASPWAGGSLLWRTVATNVVNSGTATTQLPFQLDTSTSAGYGSTLGSRVVNVTLIVNAKPGDAASKDVRLVSSMEIRNQTTDNSYCTSAPSG